MLGAEAAIAAMASLLWGGDAGAAESEGLNGHVTATEPGRARGLGARTALPEGNVLGRGRESSATVWSRVSDGGGEV